MSEFWRNLFSAFKIFSGRPALLMACSLTLGLGIGANSAICLLLRPLAADTRQIERPGCGFSGERNSLPDSSSSSGCESARTQAGFQSPDEVC